VIARHGERRGPVVGDTLSRAVVLVSTRGLASQREMDYWNYFAQRIEDPNRTGVVDEGGSGSFDLATGIDLRTDIRPRSFPQIEGDRSVEGRPFGAADIRGVLLDAPLPSQLTADVETRVTGTVTDEAAGTTVVQFVVSAANYTNQAKPPIVSLTAPVGASRRFDLPLKLPAGTSGAFTLTVSLVRPGAATLGTTLMPILVR